jgi:hypothetical protein
MNESLTPETALERHPAPWRYVALGGQVTMIDARGTPVPLFTILDFAVSLTQRLTQRRESAPAPAA